MDAGQFPDHTAAPRGGGLPVPNAAHSGVPGAAADDFAILPEHNPLLALSEQRVATIERREKFAALGIAVLIHAALVALLAWIVVSVISDPPPEFVVASTGPDTTIRDSRKDYTQSIRRDKPSPPAASSTQLLASVQPSNVAIPITDKIVDTPITLSQNEIVRLVAEEADRVYGKNNRPVIHCISINGIGEGILKDISRKFNGKYKSIEPAKL